MSTLKHFQYGDSTGALLQLDERISAAHSDPAATQKIERELIEVLESNASLAAKQEAFRRLGRIGTDNSVKALGCLLKSDDPHLAEAACYAISRRESKAATGALVAALSRPADAGLVAIANLLGDREAAGATGKLIELSESYDAPVRDSAIAALGKIATSEAVAACRAALDRGHSEAKHALLESAQRTEQRRLG
jgi:HEAT repeat protein